MLPAYLVALRTAWRESGLTAAQISARAGVCENSVYTAMSHRRNPRIRTVVAVANALGVATLTITTEPPQHRGGEPASSSSH